MPDDFYSDVAGLEGNDAPRFDQIESFLRNAKEGRVRVPELTYKYGSYALQRYSGNLSVDELWALREEVIVAALQIGKMDEAWTLVDLVQRQFPDSARASRLLGMHFEATKEPSKAQYIYEGELQKDPTNAILLRRVAAIKEGNGDIPAAIQLMKPYLEIHSADWLAWEHAASLYLRVASYSHAIFCLEEVLMAQPGNMNVWLLLADALYSAGGTANWEAAKGYYSGVIEMTNGENARALYGACACTAQMAGGRQRGGGGGGSSGESRELGTLAGETLRQQYAVRNADKLPLVTALLKKQGLM